MTALTDGSPWRDKLLPAERLVYVDSTARPMNWKVLVEQFLEGYHIRSTHKDTFYPIQYDDLNVVERVRSEQPNHVPLPEHRETA